MILNDMAVILSQQDVLQILGVVLSIGIILGAILDTRGRQLMKRIVAVVIFAFLDGIGAYAAMTPGPAYTANLVTAYTIIITVTYCIALWVGWAFFQWALRRGHGKFFKKKAMAYGISITQAKRHDEEVTKFIDDFLNRDCAEEDKG